MKWRRGHNSLFEGVKHLGSKVCAHLYMDQLIAPYWWSVLQAVVDLRFTVLHLVVKHLPRHRQLGCAFQNKLLPRQPYRQSQWSSKLSMWVVHQ